MIGQGVWILWGSKIAISHWQSQSPLTQGWRYRAARDFQHVPMLLVRCMRSTCRMLWTADFVNNTRLYSESKLEADSARVHAVALCVSSRVCVSSANYEPCQNIHWRCLQHTTQYWFAEDRLHYANWYSHTVISLNSTPLTVGLSISTKLLHSTNGHQLVLIVGGPIRDQQINAERRKGAISKKKRYIQNAILACNGKLAWVSFKRGMEERGVTEH